MQTDALTVAARFSGIAERPGPAANPLVLAMIQLEAAGASDDAIPWCSAFVNFIAWLLGLEASHSLAARSWLLVGTAIPLADATPGLDVVVFKRGTGPQPGPEIIAAQGHVAFYMSQDAAFVQVLGGNQGDKVSVARFPIGDVLGVRRLAAAV